MSSKGFICYIYMYTMSVHDNTNFTYIYTNILKLLNFISLEKQYKKISKFGVPLTVDMRSCQLEM